MTSAASHDSYRLVTPVPEVHAFLVREELACPADKAPFLPFLSYHPLAEAFDFLAAASFFRLCHSINERTHIVF
jgi:hypothetical protein